MKALKPVPSGCFLCISSTCLGHFGFTERAKKALHDLREGGKKKKNAAEGCWTCVRIQSEFICAGLQCAEMRREATSTTPNAFHSKLNIQSLGSRQITLRCSGGKESPLLKSKKNQIHTNDSFVRKSDDRLM